MGSFLECLSRSKAYIAVIWLQFGYAGMAIIAKFALNQGLNNYSFVVYRHVVATIAIAPFALIFERKVRPKMTLGIFAKIFLLALLEPVIDQNLYYVGMKYTTATFVTALCNILPAFTFIMAWIFRLEKVNLRTVISQAKVGGTMLTLAGAMLMTLVKGPMLGLPWTGASHNGHTSIIPTPEDQIKGAVMITIGCICWACFIILQVVTLRSYPAELSLTSWICAVGTIQNLVLALAMEWGNTSIWIIHFDSKMLAIAYSGIIRTGITYYIQAIILRQRGPVFITAFNPLGMCNWSGGNCCWFVSSAMGKEQRSSKDDK
ncbi:hypothetical protein V2J09_013665 [Rumex salicifolius]